MASWPPAAVTIREPENKCDRQRGDSQRQRQADASMANRDGPDREPASTANDSQKGQALPNAAANRATQTAGFAGSRYRSRRRSIKFTRPLRAHGSVSACTQGRASEGLDTAGGFGGEAGEMTCDTAPHLADTRADTMACTIAAMHQQLAQRTVARSDLLRVAPGSWCTSLLHADCGNGRGVAAFSVEARALGPSAR
jgi:hypothetical protein